MYLKPIVIQLTAWVPFCISGSELDKLKFSEQKKHYDREIKHFKTINLYTSLGELLKR